MPEEKSKVTVGDLIKVQTDTQEELKKIRELLEAITENAEPSPTFQYYMNATFGIFGTLIFGLCSVAIDSPASTRFLLWLIMVVNVFQLMYVSARSPIWPAKHKLKKPKPTTPEARPEPPPIPSNPSF
jgi:hypothetical protein